MKPKASFAVLALLGATGFFSAGLIAQDALSQKEMAPQEQAMMEALAKYAAPGEQHEFLARKAGEWTFSGKMWHDPGTPPMEIAGKSRFKSIMDGRFLIEKVEADEFMGQIFKGMGITGYDNLTQTFVGTWIDNMGTGILRSQGTASGDGKTIHYTTDHPDLITGQYIQCRAIEKINGPDEFVYTAYNTTPDGQEFKQMELTYTRIK